MQIRKLAPLAVLSLLTVAAAVYVASTEKPAMAQVASDAATPAPTPTASPTVPTQNVQHAQDVVDNATATGEELVVKFGPLWAGILGALAIARFLLKRNDSEHWLAQGRTLSALTAGVSTLGAYALFRFDGAPFEGVVATAAMGIHLIFPSSVKSGSVLSAAPATAANTQAGFVRGGAALMLSCIGLATSLALLYCATGCATLKAETKAIGSQIVSCVKADQQKAQALALSLSMQAVASLVLTGHPDWNTILTTAEQGAKEQGLDVASCAFKDVVDKVDLLLTQAAQGGVQPLVATQPDGSGRAALAAFQSKHSIAAIQ